MPGVALKQHDISSVVVYHGISTHTFGRFSPECGSTHGHRIKDNRLLVDVCSFAGDQHARPILDSSMTNRKFSKSNAPAHLRSYPKLINSPEMTLLRSPTSCSAEAMIGEPPMASVALAESLATTIFVICEKVDERVTCGRQLPRTYLVSERRRFSHYRNQSSSSFQQLLFAPLCVPCFSGGVEPESGV